MYKKIDFYPLTKCTTTCLVLLLRFCSTGAVYAQKTSDIGVTNRVILHKDGYITYADIAKAPSDRRADTRLFYYWYSANDIKRTKGGYEGKLLHGWYTRFYSNKNLNTQGKFKKGIPVGRWKYWHLNGELSEVRSWSNQGTAARFKAYDEQGGLIRTGTYKNDRYDGVVREMSSGTIIKRKYKNGVEMIKAKKPKRDSVSVAKPGDKNQADANNNDTKKDSVKHNRKFPFSGLFKKKEKKADGINLADTRSKKESPAVTPAGADTEKKKRKKSDAMNASDRSTKKESQQMVPVDSDTKKKKREKKDKKTSAGKPEGQ